MEKIHITSSVRDLIQNDYRENEPILTEEITQKIAEKFSLPEHEVRQKVNAILHRLNGKMIKHFDHGVYYKPIKGIFGEVPISANQVLKKKYIKKGDAIIGYETGPSFYQVLGLSSQMPGHRYIVSNHAKKRIVNKKLHAVIQKPRIPVTTDNVKYLQILDTLEFRDQIYADTPDFYQRIYQFIQANQLDYARLIALARQGYSKKTTDRLVEMAGVAYSS